MFVACQGGHLNMVKDLIQLGANVHASMKVIARSINFSKERNMRNSNGINGSTLSRNVNLVIRYT